MSLQWLADEFTEETLSGSAKSVQNLNFKLKSWASFQKKTFSDQNILAIMGID